MKSACRRARPDSRGCAYRHARAGLPVVLGLSLLVAASLSAPGQARAGYCLAGQCHATIVAKRYLHGPVSLEKRAQGGCELCHIPDGKSCTFSAGGSFRYADAWDNLCLGCHGSTISPDHKLPARPCVICHDPHGSDIDQKLFRKGILHEEK